MKPPKTPVYFTKKGQKIKNCTKILGVSIILRNFAVAISGEMVEWSITPVLKTGVLRGTGGSNPSLSAPKCRREPK